MSFLMNNLLKALLVKVSWLKMHFKGFLIRKTLGNTTAFCIRGREQFIIMVTVVELVISLKAAAAQVESVAKFIHIIYQTA